MLFEAPPSGEVLDGLIWEAFPSQEVLDLRDESETVCLANSREEHSSPCTGHGITTGAFPAGAGR
jgi:hypothetical protein